MGQRALTNTDLNNAVEYYFKGATVARTAYRLTAPSVDINGAVWLASAGDTATDSMGSFITFGD